MHTKHNLSISPDCCLPCPALAEFAGLVGSALHPRHGCFLLNLHSVDGRETIAAFKEALLGSSSSSTASSSSGSCFAVSSQRQLNVCITVARGLELPADGGAARERLKQVAAYAAAEAGYRFPAGGRASRGYQAL